MMGRESTQALNLSPLAPLSGAALRGKGFSLVPPRSTAKHHTYAKTMQLKLHGFQFIIQLFIYALHEPRLCRDLQRIVKR